MSHLGKYTSQIYNPEKHPKLLIEMFEKGCDVCDFASALNISERTFFRWVNQFPELDEAYGIAKAKAKVYLTTIGLANLESDKFQFNIWSLLMRNRCRATEHRTVPIDFTKCKTSNAKIKVLQRAIRDGELTPSESKMLAEVIKAGAEINEKTKIVEQVEELLKLAGKS